MYTRINICIKKCFLFWTKYRSAVRMWIIVPFPREWVPVCRDIRHTNFGLKTNDLREGRIYINNILCKNINKILHKLLLKKRSRLCCYESEQFLINKLWKTTRRAERPNAPPNILEKRCKQPQWKPQTRIAGN